MEKELAYQIAHAELTKGQVRLAGYILKNQKRVLGMTALEVGREVGMSDASVIRFCRAVGYSGFANLKVQLQKELSLRLRGPKGTTVNLTIVRLPAQRKDRQAFPV